MIVSLYHWNFPWTLLESLEFCDDFFLFWGKMGVGDQDSHVQGFPVANMTESLL